MSAESPHRSGCRSGHVVTPQPVSDRSIIESVAGFINEVVPQAYTSLPSGEGKESITWARFEYGDINDPALYPDTSDNHSNTPPLLLVLGYGTGVQVWAIPGNGEASEVLSWRQGVVRTLRVLPTPLADSPIPDAFGHKRPLVALCDSAGPGPQFCSLSFISLRSADQVKNIKFKNPVSDVLANRRSVVVTFPERIAVFDACTLEDRLTVTTCYPCPGPNPNPVALGSRWLAYSERRLLHARRSSGGMEGEGVQSYTATVLHAAKSLGKGLRELGETVASSLSGGAIQRVGGGAGGIPAGNVPGSGSDSLQPGIVTILDAQGPPLAHGDEPRPADSGPAASNADVMVAHFTAHSEPVVALAFDPSGLLLLTADKRGHDFHVFRVQPHPGGPSLAAVHHLYILHRGDTTAKVQDIAFAADSRWVAVSTLRGTTHVFPITPYGGPVGVRTHTTPHVVNRLSRFHRSAGLTADGRNSPVPTVCPASASSHESPTISPAMPYPNPRLPPYPHPTAITPLAQIRQPITHTLLSGVGQLSPATAHQVYHRNPPTRVLGRTQSVAEDSAPGGSVPLRLAACFAPPRAWLVGSPTVPRETSNKIHKRAVDSLFVMACHGSLIEYDLEPKHAAGVRKEKVCDDTPIELEVQAKAQWLLLRPPHSSELQPPLPTSNPLMVLPDHLPPDSDSRVDDMDERWLSQVEIVTHAGPHRRLWMGPQFTFKTYTATTGVPLSLLEMEAVEVGTSSGSRPARSNPVNMPLAGGARPIVPVLIESGSGSSYEQSPRLMEMYPGDRDSDGSAGTGDTQLREDLADAMMESPGVPIRDTGRRVMVTIEKVVNPVGTVITVAVPSEEEAATAGFMEDGECAAGLVRWPTSIKGNDCQEQAAQCKTRQPSGARNVRKESKQGGDKANGSQLFGESAAVGGKQSNKMGYPVEKSEGRKKAKSDIVLQDQSIPNDCGMGKTLEGTAKHGQEFTGSVKGIVQEKFKLEEIDVKKNKSKSVKKKAVEDEVVSIGNNETNIASGERSLRNSKRIVSEDSLCIDTPNNPLLPGDRNDKVEKTMMKKNKKKVSEMLRRDECSSTVDKKIDIPGVKNSDLSDTKHDIDDGQSNARCSVDDPLSSKAREFTFASRKNIHIHTSANEAVVMSDHTDSLGVTTDRHKSKDVKRPHVNCKSQEDCCLTLDKISAEDVLFFPKATTMRTWSSIATSPKAVTSPDDTNKLWTDVAAAGLNPDLLSSALEQEDLVFAEDTITKVECDIENNNKGEFDIAETSMSGPNADNIAQTPQRLWSSVVSSTKVTPISTNDGSGECDSNESKEADDLEEQSVTMLASATGTDSDMLCVGKTGEDETSLSSSNNKKSRRAKKKRR